MLTIGNRIKELRLKKEYTQPQLAKYMNVSKQTVSNWEKENRIPDANTLKKLSCFFDVSVDYLLGIVDDPNHIRVS
jgi:transcriptional regulator with XRE-family HTH domain